MSTTSTTEPTTFDRITTVVGHLDHPLYDDEHQRDVWNEASTVGYQAVTWGLLLAVTAAVWLGGRAALPYVAVTGLVLGAAAVLVMTYAQRRGVDAWRSPGGGPVRLTLCGLIGVVLVLGVVRSVDTDSGFADVAASVAGGVVGAFLLVTVAAMRVARSRAPRGED